MQEFLLSCLASDCLLGIPAFMSYLSLLTGIAVFLSYPQPEGISVFIPLPNSYFHDLPPTAFRNPFFPVLTLQYAGIPVFMSCLLQDVVQAADLF
jgi:hypothetical protein